MASETIEELVVRLALDPSQFTAGQKQVASGLEGLRGAVTNSAEGMGSALMSVAGKFAALTIGVAGLEGAISLVKRMAFEVKDLSIQAEALGSSFQTLRTMQEFSELVGAPKNSLAAYGQSGLADLYHMVFPLTPLQGQSALLGYNFGELPALIASAKTPQQEEKVWMDLQHRVQQHGPTWANPDNLPLQVNEAQILQNVLGLPEALAVALSKGQGFSTKLWNEAIAGNKSATQKQAEAATEAANAMIRFKYQVENTSMRAFGILDGMMNVASGALNLFNKALDEATKLLTDIEHSPIAKYFEIEQKVIDKGEDAALAVGRGILHADRAGYQLLDAATGGPAPGWLTRSEHAVDHAAENFIGRLIGDHHAAEAIGVLPPLNLALPAIARLRLPAFHAAPLPIPGAFHSSHTMIGGNTDDHSVSMGPVTINTQATDAAGIADGLRTQVARKFAVSQADGGITQ